MKSSMIDDGPSLHNDATLAFQRISLVFWRIIFILPCFHEIFYEAFLMPAHLMRVATVLYKIDKNISWKCRGIKMLHQKGFELIVRLHRADATWELSHSAVHWTTVSCFSLYASLLTWSLKDCLLVSWRLVDAGEGYKFDWSWRSLVVTICFFV